MTQTREKAATLRSIQYVNAMNAALGLPSIRDAWLAGDLKECPECAGNGYVPVRTTHGIETDDCPVCKGEGWVK